MAAEASQMDLVELLIKSNANVNAVTRQNKDTPLHYARDWPVIATLLEFGADPDVRNTEGKTYLDWCCDRSASPYFLGPLTYTQDRPDDYNKACGGNIPFDKWERFKSSVPNRSEVIKTNLRHLRKYNRSLTGLDAIKDNAEDIKVLRSVIGRHEPYSGVCYFTADASPVDIWSLAFLGYFYLPTFVTAKPDSYNTLFGSVIFEVDTRGFDEFATRYEDTVVLTCYNIYHYAGYRVEEGKIFVRLEVQNYHGMIKGEDRALNTRPKGTTTATASEQDPDFLAAASRIDSNFEQFQKMLQDLHDRCPFTAPIKPSNDNPKKRGQKQSSDLSGLLDSLEALGVPTSKLDSPLRSVREGIYSLSRTRPFPMPPLAVAA